MKNAPLLFVLILLFVSCQQEFPPAPDYSTRSVSVTENWKYPVPQGERIIWIDIDGSDILYLTVSGNEVKTYLFNENGDLIHTYSFTHPYPPDEYTTKRKVGDWISFPILSHKALLNYRTGESFYVLEDEDLVKDSAFNYYLSEDNVCFYTKVDKSKHYLLTQWNLSSGTKEVLDTLLTATKNAHSLSVLGQYRKPLGSINANLIFWEINSELFNEVYRYNLVGFALDDFYGNQRWESPVLFRNNDRFRKEKVLFHNTLCYFTTNKMVYCLDPIQQEIKWARSFGDALSSEFYVYKDKLYFVTSGGNTYCLDALSGNTYWQKSFGKYVRKLEVTNGLLVLVGYKKIDNTTLVDQANQLHIVEAKTGKELYRSNDPLNIGAAPVNDHQVGLSQYVAQQDDIIYLADDTYFFSLRLKTEN